MIKIANNVPPSKATLSRLFSLFTTVTILTICLSYSFTIQRKASPSYFPLYATVALVLAMSVLTTPVFEKSEKLFRWIITLSAISSIASLTWMAYVKQDVQMKVLGLAVLLSVALIAAQYLGKIKIDQVFLFIARNRYIVTFVTLYVSFGLVSWKPFHKDWKIYPVLTGILVVLSLSFLQKSHSITKLKYRLLVIGISWLFGLFLAIGAAFYPSIDFHHYSYFTGPIHGIHNGGFLLYDVPSQYGFLNLLIANLFSRNPWDAMFIAVGVFQLISWLILVILIKKVLDPNPLGLLIIMLATIGMVFFMQGAFELFLKSNAFPSVGAFRFIWIYILAAILVSSASNKNKYILGSIAWGVSLFWSIEAACYSTLIWIPTFCLLRAGNSKTIKETITHTISSVIILAVVAATSICIFYSLYYALTGVLPDLNMYVEYGLIYKNGFGWWKMTYLNPIVYLLFCTALLASSTAFQITYERERLAYGYAAFAIFYSSLSYFVARAHPNNLCNLFSLTVLSFCVMCYGLKYATLKNIFRLCIYGFIGFSSIFLVSIYLLRSITDPYSELLFFRNGLSLKAPHSQDMFILTEPLQKNLTSYGFNQSSKITYLNGELVCQNNSTCYQGWLMAFPTSMLNILPQNRLEIYLKRSLARYPGESLFLIGEKQEMDGVLSLLKRMDANYEKLVVVDPKLTFVKVIGSKKESL